LVVRTFLLDSDPTQTPLPYGTDLLALKPGDVLPKNWLTNWDDLRALIKRYNAICEPSLRIDEEMADIRNAFGHGRVISAAADGAGLRLIRFKPPSNGDVVVEAVDLLTAARLNELVGRSYAAIKIVMRATRQSGPGSVQDPT
jgi:hypothetical protein